MGKLQCNPWFSIWVKPKCTIQAINEMNPNYGLGILSALYGFPALLGIAQSFSFGYSIGMIPIILLAIILSPIFGYLIFSIVSWPILLTGKWINGMASYAGVRSSIAWAALPNIIQCAIWILLISLFGRALFTNFQDIILNDMTTLFFLFIFIVQAVASIWSLVIFINTLAEVQQFSVLRAILNIFLAALFLLAVCLLVFVVGNFFYKIKV